MLDVLALEVRPLPRAALFQASKAFSTYRQRGGIKTGVLPDFFFHIAIAHAILRHLGAHVGKRDYLGNLST